MIRRLPRQLIVFIVLAAVSVTFVSVNYVNLPRMLGIGRYMVTVEQPRSGGVYVNAAVTVRGIQVGQVSSVEVDPSTVRVEVEIDDDVRIPRDTPVEIRSVSAVGEQYVNFAPKTETGPYLADGDIVPAQLVSLPVSTAELLGNVNQLVATLPAEKITTVTNELATGFANSGPDLQRLIDSTSLLIGELTDRLPPTITLINDLGPVLATQRRVAPEIRSFTGDLARFTDQLRLSDSDLRGTLDEILPFADETVSLVNDLRPIVPRLLRNLTSVGEVTDIYLPHLRQTVTLLQITTNNTTSAIYEAAVPGTVQVNVQVNTGNPAACTQGFLPPEQQRPPQDLSPVQPATQASCKVPENAPQTVRGARNYPCPPGSPRQVRGPSASDCGLNFQTPEEARRATEEAVATQLEAFARNPKTAFEDTDGRKPRGYPNTGPPRDSDVVPYDQNTGLFFPPGGQPMIYGNSQSATPSSGFKRILLEPLGVPAS